MARDKQFFGSHSLDQLERLEETPADLSFISGARQGLPFYAKTNAHSWAHFFFFFPFLELPLKKMNVPDEIKPSAAITHPRNVHLMNAILTM